MTPSEISKISPPAGSPPVSTAGQVAVTPCVVTRRVVPGRPNTYTASGSPIKLKIIPGGGTILFDPPNCSVTDNAGNTVNFDPAASPTALSFPVVTGQGKSYTLQIGFIVSNNATATLVEDCAAQTHIADLFAVMAIGGAILTFTVN